MKWDPEGLSPLNRRPRLDASRSSDCSNLVEQTSQKRGLYVFGKREGNARSS